jgi:hypothetical protein
MVQLYYGTGVYKLEAFLQRSNPDAIGNAPFYLTDNLDKIPDLFSDSFKRGQIVIAAFDAKSYVQDRGMFRLGALSASDVVKIYAQHAVFDEMETILEREIEYDHTHPIPLFRFYNHELLERIRQSVRAGKPGHIRF